MGVPTSEVGYTIATTTRERHKVHKNRWWHWGEKKKSENRFILQFRWYMSTELLGAMYLAMLRVCETLEGSSNPTETQLYNP